MEATDDIDTQGYWTTDDYEALLGLAAYRYLAQRVGRHRPRPRGPRQQYDSLLAATNATLGRHHPPVPPRLPALLDHAAQHRQPVRRPGGRQLGVTVRATGPGTGSLLGAPLNGPGLVHDRRHLRTTASARLKGMLPPNTFGGFPDDYYSSGYNAGYGNGRTGQRPTTATRGS